MIKRIPPFVLLALALLLGVVPKSNAQGNFGCPNADFSFGNFQNWTGGTGICCPTININVPNVIVNGRHTIMTPGTDNIVPMLQRVPPGYNQSARLGNSSGGRQAERLAYSFVVNNQNTLFTYEYAVVLQYPAGHPVPDQPKFQIQVRNQNGQIVPCTFLNVWANPNLPGWGSYAGYVWKNWTKSGIDLSQLSGQTVTIEAQSGDCGWGGHSGHGYLVAECRPLQIDIAYCQGDTLATLTAPAGFANYLWSNGATTPSVTIQNPHLNVIPWSVTLTSQTGCNATLSTNIQPIVPVAHFTTSNLCNGTIQFTDSTIIPNSWPSNWSWDFGDGNSGTGQSPIHQYQQPGTYNVTLIAEAPAGCADTVTLPVTVPPVIQPGFSMDTLCGLNKQFTDLSSISSPGTLVSHAWDFGDGNTSNQQNPGHTYAAPGSYNVSLIVGDNAGCYDTITQQINVNAIPTAAFTFQSVCTGNNLPFINQSTLPGWGNMTYTWDFGNGNSSFQQSPWHNYQQSGTYTVTLIATGAGNCSDTATQQVTVHPVPVASFTLPPPCGLTGQITNTSTIASPGTITSNQWNLGNGQTSGQQNPNFNFATPGTYPITLTTTSSNGCVDTETQNFTVYAIPNAQYTAPQTCHGNAVPFTNTSSVQGGGNLAYNWDYGNGQNSNQQSPNYNYPQHGTYNTSLVVTGPGGCTDTATQVVVVPPTPTASFTMPDSCGLSDSFLSTSAVAQPGNINTYHWDLGNGQTLNTQNAAFNYQSPGTYAITHAVTTADGCTDTTTQNFTVYAIPQAAFSGPQTCHGNAVPFQDLSTIQNSQITQWDWSYGNGQNGNTQNPAYSYPQHGQYNVTLVVTGVGGCTDTAANPINIPPTPVAGFTLPDSCGLTNAFSNLSSIAQPGTITSNQWNFGNGQSSNQQNPTHQYTNPGSYNISLIVVSNEGCSDTLVQPFTTWSIPQAAFSVPQTCDETPAPFSDQSTIPNSTIANWQWDFGDGNSSNQQNPAHLYGTHGQYNITLVVTGQGGCTDTVTNPLLITPKPVTNFALPPSCGMIAPFINQSSIPAPGSIATWDWDFDDGNSSSANSPTHTYADNGTYNVTLIATSNEGCTDTISIPYTNYHWPVAAFTAPNTCHTAPSPFTDNSTVQNDQISQWQWTTGDGGNYTNATFNHTYGAPGAFPITLIVTSSNGCTDTVTGNTTVWPLPEPDFSAQSVCSREPVIFNNSSSIAGGSITGYTWNFGSDSVPTSYTVDPVVQYAADGTYQVTLMASSNHGCIDSITKPVSIFPRPRINFTADPVEGCAPLRVYFENQTTIPGDNTVTGITWDLGNGNTSNQDDPNQWYMNPGFYTVSMYAISDKGCDTSVTVNDMIEVHALPDAQFKFTPEEPTIVNRNIEFFNQSLGGPNQFYWDMGDGTTHSSMNVSHVYPADTGTYYIYLWVATENGCSDSITHVLSINPDFTVFIPNSFSPNEDGLNDFFKIEGRGMVEAEMWIFNRWGDELIYMENMEPLEKGWNGFHADKLAKQDVYVYRIRVRDFYGEWHEFRGKVNLVR